MIRNLVARGRLGGAINSAAASVSSSTVQHHAAACPKIAGAVESSCIGSSSSIRSYSLRSRPLDGNSSSMQMEDKEKERSSRYRGTSPGPNSRLVTKIMCPKSNSSHRSFGTAPPHPPQLEAAATLTVAATTSQSPIRHSIPSESLEEASSIYRHEHHELTEDYDELSHLSGYVTAGMETTIPVIQPPVATDSEIDVVSDYEEELSPTFVLSSSAEQMLTMMNTSYYHASYQAHDHDEGSIISSRS